MANELGPVNNPFIFSLDELNTEPVQPEVPVNVPVVQSQEENINPFVFTSEELSQFQQEADNTGMDFGVGQQDDFDESMMFVPTAEELYGPLQTEQQYKKDASIITRMSKAASRGIGRGVTGQVLGAPQDTGQTDNFLEYLAEFGGELASDVPAYSGGAALGSLIGGALGSIIPGAGTALGATLGAAFMGMALPVMVKSSFNEYRDYAKKGGNGSFEDFIARTGSVLAETGKAGTVGLVTANMGRFVPLLKKVPIWNKVLNTRAGQKVTYKGLEYLGLNAAQSLIEGELPTKEQLRDNAVALIGMEIAHKFGAPVKKFIPEPIKKAPSRFIQKTIKVLPESIRRPIQQLQQYSIDVKNKVQNKQYFDWLKENVGQRESKMVEQQMDILYKTKTKDASGKWINKWTPKVMEDMIYARQKTGNPNIPGDTYAKLQKRMPADANVFLKKDVNNFFEGIRKSINADPKLKDINFRENYLPGLWKGDVSKIKLPKDFSLYNAFANPKQFATIVEAAQKAGLKPKFNNIVDFMAAYSDMTTKLLAKSKISQQLDVMNKDKDLIVTSDNKKKYDAAKKAGYIPFDDEFLRKYKGLEEYIGSEIKTGFQFEEKRDLSIGEKYLKKKYDIRPGEDVYKVKEVPKVEHRQAWKTSEGPALVDPRLADAIQGIFNKRGAVSESKFWQNYDTVADIIRTGRVQLSPFHAVALTESAIGALGFRKGLNFKWIASQGDELLSSKHFRKKAAMDGLKLEKPIDYRQGSNFMDKTLDYVASKGGRITKAATGKLKKGMNWMFEKYHPRLKAVTYNELLNKELGNLIKQGKPATEVQRRAIGRDVASLVNSMYGGQNWETSKFFNDPNTMKWLRRFIAYPDWTISALKQAGSAFSSGIKGKQGRQYWANYMIKTSLLQAGLKYVFGGLEQTDKKDNSISGLRWSRDKAAKNFWDGDPSKAYMFALPDVNIKIGSSIFNPGRDSKGRRSYGHLGKQALEILGYGTRPVQTLFGKGNPILQLAYQQLIGATPAGDMQFPVRGKYDEGEFKPWDATKSYTPERVVSRVKALMQGVLPFSISSLTSRGVGPYVGSGFGAVPVSRGMNLRTAEKYVARALRNKDSKLLSNVIRILIDNGYKDVSINGLITKVSNRVNKR